MVTRSELGKMIGESLVKNGGQLINPTGSTGWGDRAGEIYIKGVVDQAALTAARTAQATWGTQKVIGISSEHDYTPEQAIAILDEIAQMTQGQKTGPNFLKIGLSPKVLEDVEMLVRS